MKYQQIAEIEKNDSATETYFGVASSLAINLQYFLHFQQHNVSVSVSMRVCLRV